MIRFALLSAFSHVCVFAFSQNVGIGTSSPAGKLHIKGTDNISQLTIDADTIQSNIFPLITLRKSNGDLLFWIHSDHPENVFIGHNSGSVNTGLSNSFIGYKAGESNTSGDYNTAFGASAFRLNTTGNFNTAIGRNALGVNTTGYNNTGIGSNTLTVNKTGYRNTTIGSNSMSRNTSGYENVVGGVDALWSNVTGYRNVAIGTNAMFENEEGIQNTAVGHRALWNNTFGNYNVAIGYDAVGENYNGSEHTAVGYQALAGTNGSWGNTAVGHKAGMLYDPQYQTTYLGHSADANGNDLANSMALGSFVTFTANNQVRIGWAVTSIGGPQNWTNTSDARIKQNVRSDVPGLDFIRLLRPVTYTRSLALEHAIIGRPMEYALSPDNQYESIRYSGFLAQDVEAAARSIGYDFSGIDAPQNEKSLYGLRYAEFVVPLVKAVQELNEQNRQLRMENEEFRARIEQLEAAMQSGNQHKRNR